MRPSPSPEGLEDACLKSALNKRKSKPLSRVVEVSRVQNTFPEDPDRFDVGKPKRSYNQKTHQMQPPQGPSSASPGPWVPETITNAWMEANRDPIKLALLPKLPEYKNAVTVRDSYRQYVFGPVVFPPVDDSPRFSMVEQPNVLAGERWLKSDLRSRSLYKLTQRAQELESHEDTEHEGSLYSLNDDGEVEDTDEQVNSDEADFLNEGLEIEPSEEPDEDNTPEKFARAPKYVRVSDDEMDLVYRQWFKEPSHGNRQYLFETPHNFFSPKSKSNLGR